MPRLDWLSHSILTRTFRSLHIAIQADGKILVGGAFASIGGQTRNFIARLDAVTGMADSFNPNSNGFVYTIAVQADGKILAGGNFFGANSIGGQTRNRLARLDPTTGVADSFNPNANGFEVDSIVVQPDGKVLVGGDFTTMSGQARNNIARINPNGTLDTVFNPNASNPVLAMALQPDGKILIGGVFTILTPNSGALTRNRIARLETDGRADRTLNDLNLGGANPIVSAIALQPDGKILIGGSFTSVLGVTQNKIARLNTDGTLDLLFNPDPNDDVLSIAVQTDGKVLVCGAFTFIGGQPRNRIARLSEGTADSFNPNANGAVYSIAVQADGKILAGGDFGNIGGSNRVRIARLNAVTGAADSFNPSANNSVFSIAVQPDGKILAGGYFDGLNSIGGQSRGRIARLDAGTGAADSWNPNASGTDPLPGVFSIAVQTDGKVLAGGRFTTIGGQTRNRIARLDSTTGMADSFNPSANNQVDSIAVQADGKILAGGKFTSIGGQSRGFIARLDAVTGAADGFAPNSDSDVLAIAVQADGKILVGGRFTSIGGQARNNFARLNNDTIASQNLSVTQNNVVWIHDGSSPQFNRVTFEDSTDGVIYNFLGSGTASGSNWTLTGLNLPTQQNLFIRARGFYRSGIYGSESIRESVRNVFLVAAAPLQVSTAASRKTHGTAGDFDIPLPIGSAPGVECRSSGGGHTLVFTFTNNVVSGNASVTAGTGSISGSPSFSGNTMTVNLSGVADVQQISVTLSGVTDSFGQVLPNTAVSMNVLAGDVNGSKSVNGTDVGQAKAQSGAAVTSANFRLDVVPSGTINGTDIGLVKSRSREISCRRACKTRFERASNSNDLVCSYFASAASHLPISAAILLAQPALPAASVPRRRKSSRTSRLL